MFFYNIFKFKLYFNYIFLFNKMQTINQNKNNIPVSKITYRKRVEYIVNLTLGEYFVSSSIEDRENKMNALFEKMTEKTSIIKQSIGTSRWEKSDNIKLIINQNKLLCKYIRENYSSVWMHNVIC
jgi:hypothetical protein